VGSRRPFGAAAPRSLCSSRSWLAPSWSKLAQCLQQEPNKGRKNQRKIKLKKWVQ
jgi:hypothetical protein